MGFWRLSLARWPCSHPPRGSSCGKQTTASSYELLQQDLADVLGVSACIGHIDHHHADHWEQKLLVLADNGLALVAGDFNVNPHLAAAWKVSAIFWTAL